MPSEALQADCLSGEVPWAEPFVPRNFSFERQWCGRCGPFQVHRVKACTAGCLKPAPETNFCWMNEHPPLFEVVNLSLLGETQNTSSNLHKMCRTVNRMLPVCSQHPAQMSGYLAKILLTVILGMSKYSMFSPSPHGSILACLGSRVIVSKWRPEVSLSINL